MTACQGSLLSRSSASLGQEPASRIPTFGQSNINLRYNKVAEHKHLHACQVQVPAMHSYAIIAMRRFIRRTCNVDTTGGATTGKMYRIGRR